MSKGHYLTYLLRHHPEDEDLDMDIHGYVKVDQLLERFSLTKSQLDQIVATDNKQRFKYSSDGLYIKACQGHSIPWVIPELTYKNPPDILYHGTTHEAYQLILETGYISKMGRHAVHMQATMDKSIQSATRWHKTPVVLEIDAHQMVLDGYEFGISDNDVWCIEQVPVQYIKREIFIKK